MILDENISLIDPETSGNKGHYSFSIHHKEHGVIGFLNGRLHGDTFDVSAVGMNQSHRPEVPNGANGLGPAQVRVLARDLRRHTGARYVTSDSRDTGMRQKLGGSRIVPRVRISEVADALILQKLREAEAYAPVDSDHQHSAFHSELSAGGWQHVRSVARPVGGGSEVRHIYSHPEHSERVMVSRERGVKSDTKMHLFSPGRDQGRLLAVHSGSAKRPDVTRHATLPGTASWKKPLREARRISPVVGGVDHFEPISGGFWVNPRGQRAAHAWGDGNIATSTARAHLISPWNYSDKLDDLPVDTAQKKIHKHVLRRLTLHGVLAKRNDGPYGERYVKGEHWDVHHEVLLGRKNRSGTANPGVAAPINIHDVGHHSLLGVRADPVGETTTRHLMTVMNHVNTHGTIMPRDHAGLRRKVTVLPGPVHQRYQS